jgi:hypothetical protein
MILAEMFQSLINSINYISYLLLSEFSSLVKLFLQVKFTELCNDVTVVDACENIVALQDVRVGWQTFDNFHLAFKQFVAGF